MRRGCIHCGWNGHSHLCGCMSALSQALKAGDLVEARTLFGGIVGRANADERSRRENPMPTAPPAGFAVYERENPMPTAPPAGFAVYERGDR